MLFLISSALCSLGAQNFPVLLSSQILSRLYIVHGQPRSQLRMAGRGGDLGNEVGTWSGNRNYSTWFLVKRLSPCFVNEFVSNNSDK